MKKCLICFCLIILSFYAKAQLPELPKSMTSPNVTNLGEYGKVPMSLFTGTPSISIPLYDMKVNNISIPISLTYLASSAKPDNNPSWVGHGWTLNAGGVISRVVNDLPDEYENKKSHLKLGYYYSEPMSNGDYKDNYIEIALINGIDVDKGKMFRYAWKDSQTDEYSFNFLGYSGKFYITGGGKVVVQCAKDIKVLISKDRYDPTFPKRGTVSNVLGYSLCFSTFTIVTEDGTRYIFGKNENAIELSVDFFYQESAEWSATAWHLTQIQLTNGEKIDLEYERGNYTNRLYHTEKVNLATSIENSHGGCYVFGNNVVDKSNYGGHLISPVYLKRIKYSDSFVTFKRSKSNELAYDKSIYYLYQADFLQDQNADWHILSDGSWLPQWIIPYDDIDRFLPLLENNLGISDLDAILDSLKPNKLDEIVINNGKDRRVFEFSYSNKENERLLLSSLEEVIDSNLEDEQSWTERKESKKYSFAYNHPELLPRYLSPETDHWGFYNAGGSNASSSNLSGYPLIEILTPTLSNPISTNGTFNYFIENPSYYEEEITKSDIITSKYYLSKEPNSAVMGYGLLNKITYPTKGYTRFVYEPNQYRKQVSLARDSCEILDKNKIGGGVRIKEIWNSTSGKEADEFKTKEYLYVNDYLQHKEDADVSSGILGTQIQYTFTNVAILSVLANEEKKTIANGEINYIAFQSYIPNFANLFGGCIGYTKVIEKNPDGSRVIYSYSNYDTGALDEQVMYISDESDNKNRYMPCSSKEMERGLLLRKEVYNEAFNLQLLQNNEYEKDCDKRISVLKTSMNLLEENCVSLRVASCPIHLYNMRLKSDTTKIYENGLTTPKTTIKEYTYNNHKLLKETKTKTTFKTLREIYNYVSDYPDDVIYAQMKKKNILSPIVEKKSLLKTESNTDYKLLKGTRCEYKKWSTSKKDLYLPSLIEISENGGGYKPSANIQKYDSRGHAVYFIDSNNVPNVFIWGYNYKYLVSMIKNSTLEEVEDVLGSLDNFSSTNTPNFTLLEQLRRRLSNAEVTYGKYCSFGLTEQIDARGVSTYYTYDSFGRLSGQKDYNTNLVENYSYNYKKESNSDIILPNPDEGVVDLSVNLSVLPTYCIGTHFFRLNVSSKGLPSNCDYHYFWTLTDSNGDILLEKETNYAFSKIKLPQIGEVNLSCRVEERLSNQVATCHATFNVEKNYIGFTGLQRIYNNDTEKQQSLQGTINCADSTIVKFKFKVENGGNCTLYINERKDVLVNDGETIFTRKLSKGKNDVILEMLDGHPNSKASISIIEVNGLNQIGLTSKLYLWLTPVN